jgi:hypothetical protein
MENITTTKQPTNWSALSIVISLFFFWGFVAASNSMLIPLFREKLQLSQTQAQLVDLAFYIAYFVGSMIYLLVGRSMGQDPLNKIGYKRGVIIGLLISAFGMALFYPIVADRCTTVCHCSGRSIVRCSTSQSGGRYQQLWYDYRTGDIQLCHLWCTQRECSNRRCIHSIFAGSLSHTRSVVPVACVVVQSIQVAGDCE